MHRLPKFLELISAQVFLKERLKLLKLALQILSSHSGGQIELIIRRDRASIERLDFNFTVWVIHARNLVDGHVESVPADASRHPILLLGTRSALLIGP